MRLSDEAYEAARDAVYAHISTAERPSWLIAVEAAAPFIRAESLREASLDTNCMDDSDLLECKAEREGEC